ncbi:MAG: glycosyltransferase family 4 protein [Patescibacteria group bacterium]|nr:glycosyltransferase family 4 protein [Patescibacteria group bacterium]
MKILFFSHYFPPENNAPASRTYDHCARWAAAGHDVTVITSNPNCPDGVVYPGYQNRLLRQVDWVDGVRVVRVWTYLASNAGTWRRIANYLSYMVSAVVASLRLGRPDVIIATSPQFFCGWAGVAASWLKWTPLVLEIRDIWPESIVAVGAMRNRRVVGILERLERRMYLAARHIVAVGDGYRDNILGKVAVADRISVITNGVDLVRYSPREPDASFLNRWSLDGKFVCSYVGTIGMAHGLEVVIEAAKRLRARGRDDVRFCLVGDGATRQSLQEQACRAGVSDMVVFTGRLPKEEMPTVLASSDACLVHLKGCELFETVVPSKIFEIMAMGRPIIMGVKGQSRRMVIDAGAGLEMEPDCPESLVAAVETLAADGHMGRHMGRSGADYVRRHFDRNALAARYEQLLTDLIGVVPIDRSAAMHAETKVGRGKAA